MGDEEEPVQTKSLSPNITPLIQKQTEEEEEKEPVQTKSFFTRIIPFVQRQDENMKLRFGTDFRQVCGLANAHTNIQAKLKVNAPRDTDEQEAYRVAGTVIHMHDPEIEPNPTWAESPSSSRRHEVGEIMQIQSKPLNEYMTCWIQRQIGKREIEEELVKALTATGATVQRQVAELEETEKDQEEEKLMQAKASGRPKLPATKDLGAKIHSMEGSGQPLPLVVRNFMEQRFGYDFRHVRVHTDAKADTLARVVNARAFTAGRNVAFAAGQYAPGTSTGKRLLAHELTHVIQQGYRPSRIQRRIIVGGTPYTPTAKYYTYLNANFGSHMKEFIKNMHNNGNPPDFPFTSYEQMGYEVRVRHQAIKGIAAVHAGCCNYYDSAHPDYLDSTYWDRVSWMHFKPKSPLPSGKEASDAIDAIFAPGAGTRLECMAMTVAVEYYSLLKGLGKTKFNAKFPGGAGLEISTRLASGTHPTFYGPSRLYKNITLSSKSEILPGDWVYFLNFHDYSTRNPTGFWQGENAIYLGNGNYRGFGVPSLTEAGMNAELVSKYNTELSESKTVPDLLADGGGLLLAPVFRPDIKKLVP